MPTGRISAPKLTFAAIQKGKQQLLVLAPAVQAIANSAAFTAATQKAIVQAEQGNIVILGVTPIILENPRGMDFC